MKEKLKKQVLLIPSQGSTILEGELIVDHLPKDKFENTYNMKVKIIGWGREFNGNKLSFYKINSVCVLGIEEIKE